MKHLVLILFIAIGSCSQKNNDLIGTWQLIEEKIDIGNGLGQFAKTNNSKTVTFLADGIIKSSGSLCHMPGLNDKGEIGTYSNTTISSKSCIDKGRVTTVTYELIAGELIIMYFCNEPCGEKYVKLIK